MESFVVFDYGDKPDEVYYCEAQRLPDGKIMITDFGRVLEPDPEQGLLENPNGAYSD